MALDPQLVQDLLHTARQRGATAGDALLVDNESFEVQVRLGEVERAALDYDSRITNSEGGEYSSSQSHVLYANSHGFVGQYHAGTVGLSVSPIASEAGGMQSDYWYATGRQLSQLQAPAAIGQEAARRALRR